ncbi:MAG: parallel beta-helix domain-containing protein, partial [Saprospiraceae bacterium]
KGDAVKTQDVDGMAFVEVATIWTGKAKASNGAYGLYPVQCQNVLIDKCEAVGASDAGIYVGQSDKVIVRNCRAYRNVAGIEIENTTNADVYDNIAEENTGGILVFDLPGLIKKSGGHVRVYRNKIIKNNYKNFAPEGNIVATVPSGSGVIVLATSDVEIFENEIINHKTFGISVASYYAADRPFDDDQFDPFAARIHIHNNVFERKKQLPTLKNDMGKLAFLKFKRDLPDIAYDGIKNKDQWDGDQMKSDYKICIHDNNGANFANMDLENRGKNVSMDASVFDCTGRQLPAVELMSKDR